MQRGRGPTFHWIDQLVRQSNPLNPGQALAVATLNVVLTLAYKEINPNAEVYRERPPQQLARGRRGKGQGA